MTFDAKETYQQAITVECADKSDGFLKGAKKVVRTFLGVTLLQREALRAKPQAEERAQSIWSAETSNRLTAHSEPHNGKPIHARRLRLSANAR